MPTIDEVTKLALEKLRPQIEKQISESNISYNYCKWGSKGLKPKPDLSHDLGDQGFSTVTVSGEPITPNISYDNDPSTGFYNSGTKWQWTGDTTGGHWETNPAVQEKEQWKKLQDQYQEKYGQVMPNPVQPLPHVDVDPTPIQQWVEHIKQLQQGQIGQQQELAAPAEPEKPKKELPQVEKKARRKICLPGRGA